MSVSRGNQLSPVPPSVASGGGVSAARSQRRNNNANGSSYAHSATKGSTVGGNNNSNLNATNATIRSSAATPPIFHPRVAASRGTTFLRDSEGTEAVLPMPLPRGMPFAAAFTSFEDLVSRDILVQPEARRVYLSTQDARIIFEAKCADQGLKPCWERELRFLELVSSNCQGMMFSLRENGLGQNSAAAIAHVLSKNVHFALLDLSGNKLATDGGFEVAKMLEQNDSLVHLNLRSNDIGPDAIGAIADALVKNNTITSLDLGGLSGVSRNHIGTFGAKALGEMLKVNNVLAMLNLSSSGLGAEGTRLVADGLNENTTLSFLDLSNNNISHVGSQKLCEVIQHSTLLRLNLAGNGLGDRGAKHVARAYNIGNSGCDNLVRLNLEGNGIGPAGATELAKMVHTNPKLQVLVLSKNPIAEGIVEIADKLRDNRCLKELYLESCALNEEGAIAVAFALSKGCVIEKLDMSKNRTGDSGARAFAAHLSNKNERAATLTRIKHLDLSGSAIGNEGGMDLAKMVSENSTLTELILRQNLIGGNVGNYFDEAFRKSDCRLQANGNQSLLYLDLSFNDIPFQAHSKIEASLARNRGRHKEGTVPRLKRDIEELEEQQSDLFSKESEIESERRANRDKTEEIARRRDMSRAQADQNRRQTAELSEEVQAAQAVHAQKKSELQAIEQKLQTEQTKLEGKLSQLNHKVDIEREKKERVFREIDKCKKQLKARADADEEFLRPYEDDFRLADASRNKAKNESRSISEMLMQMQIQILKASMKQAGVVPNPMVMLGKDPNAGAEAGNDNGGGAAKQKAAPAGRRTVAPSKGISTRNSSVNPSNQTTARSNNNNNNKMNQSTKSAGTGRSSSK